LSEEERKKEKMKKRRARAKANKEAQSTKLFYEIFCSYLSIIQSLVGPCRLQPRPSLKLPILLEKPRNISTSFVLFVEIAY
jgi:hypothetical protein